MKSLNFLKACAVNSFLKALNNPEEVEGFISDASILSEQGKADFANFLYQDSLKEEREDIKNAIQECANIWTPAFILAVINTNRSSVPYTLQDVENATTAGADILTFGKACSMDDRMNPVLSKALNTSSIEGFRIFPEQSLEKANKKGTPQYEEWLRKYREKRAVKAKPEEAAKGKAAAKDVLEGKSSTQINRTLSKDFSDFRGVKFKDFNKKGDSFVISSKSGLGDMKVTLLEDASSTEEMKRNSPLDTDVYNIEHLKCKFDFNGNSWEGTIAHHENWNPDYPHSNTFQFFEEDSKPWIKQMRNALEGKETIKDSRTSGEKGRDTAKARRDKEFEQFQDMSKSDFTHNKGKVISPLRNKIISTFSSIGDNGSSKFKFLGDEYTLSAKTNETKESTTVHGDQVVRSSTTYSLKDSRGNELASYKNVYEDYPDRNPKIRERVGKEVHVPANSNTSIRLANALIAHVE